MASPWAAPPEDAMAGNSRAPGQPLSEKPTSGDFGQLSNFLRASIADEDSRRVSESMSELATHVEAIILSLRHGKVRTTIAPMLVDLLTVLRAHRHMVVDLGPAWRSQYE